MRGIFFLVFLIGLLTVGGSGGCAKTKPPEPIEGEKTILGFEVEVIKGTQFLLDRQSADGAWRSETYGSFKDGSSLTPLVVHVLQGVPHLEKTSQAIDKGAAYLAAMVKPDGGIDPGPHGITYPVYTAALSVMVLTDTGKEEHLKARDAWLKYLKDRQLTEDMGWDQADKEYGGWGYCAAVPKKPKAGDSRPQLLESNLSATAFALEAMETAGVPPDDSSWKKALAFVQRCQNFNAEEKNRDPEYDDGGFFFIYDDPVRNKAGRAGKDKNGRERFASYGSTTADGLRCLAACGLHPLEDSRVAAARQWLVKNFSPVSHPGKFAAEREANRNAVYFYYCLSLSKTFEWIPEAEGEIGKVRWVDPLAEALMKRQNKEGSWSNELVNYREDDPILATALALGALSQCQLAGQVPEMIK